MTPDMDPLAQLRDIHEPAAIPWWPPAPGWWLLGALLLVALAALLVLAYRQWQQRAYRRAAARAVQAAHADWQSDGNDLAFARSLNQILKRTALATYGRPGVASLSGADWCAFLDHHARPSATGYAQSGLDRLHDPGWQLSRAELDSLHRLTRDWVAHHRVAA